MLRVSKTLRVGVDDQVEVALPVADLDVAEAVPFLGSGTKHLTRNSSAEAQTVSSFVLVRNSLPPDADEVAEVEELEDGEVPLGQRVLPDVDLDARPAVGNHQEVRLAETANRQDPPRGGRFYWRRLQCLGCGVAVCGDECIDVVGAIECPGGYGSTPRRTSSSKLARRWRS